MTSIGVPTGRIPTPIEPQRFLSPREVLAGPGSIARLGDLLRKWVAPSGRAFLVCDGIVSQLGFAEAVRSALSEEGWDVTVFDAVVGEPDRATAEDVTAVVRASDYSAVIGLGGGSTMDVAKIAAALATHRGGVDSIVGVDRLDSAPLPLILVPTTAGTGSEATRIAMLSLEGRKGIINDSRLVPVAAVLDASLLRSVPPSVTATTGMDALSHAIEGALSLAASPLSINASNEAVSLLARWLPAAYKDGDNIDARQGTMYAAYLAGLALNAGSVLGHSMGYTIANRTALSHGATVAMALPFCLAYCAEGASERIADMWARVSNYDEDAIDIYDWITRLMRSFGMASSLDSLGLNAQDAIAMAEECVMSYPRPNNPVVLEQERVSSLYRHFLTGDLDACLEELGVRRGTSLIGEGMGL